MALNPRRSREDIWNDQLMELFAPNQSPYFNMFKAGFRGIPIENVVARLTQIGIPVRSKDIQAWQDGYFKYQMKQDPSFTPPVRQITETGVVFEEAKLSDFPMFPQSWQGTERRFFPCTNDNRPMQKWGWSKDFTPQLYDYASAKALSPCGWVGQNMLYQRFIVLDIDGRGHGDDDLQVIQFGEQFKQMTMCMEDPAKLGSFHLYFSTDRLIPVKHFPYAKLDLMGNAVNAAVYLKNKVSNGLPMAQLTEDIWQAVMAYQKGRKE